MKKVRLDIIGLSSSHSQIGHYALVLGEAEGNRRLPIIIGGAEAQAIALELEDIKTNRPMTHDLIFNLSSHFDINLLEIVINDLHEGVFYARLILEHNGEIHEIDSRPSDAVAIAVRFRAPIYAFETVLDEAGIIISEEGEGTYADEESEFSLTQIEQSEPIEEEPEEPAAATGGKDAKVNKLTKLLEEALGREDYERAAQLRDEISRMKKG
ncbi:MAG: bifunctional nuclease family protein [Bacteroidota bacterium]